MPGPLKHARLTNCVSLRHISMCAGVIAIALLTADLSGCAAPSSTHASTGASGSSTRLPPPSVTLHPNPAFAALPTYEGTLGKRAIVLHLGEKTDPEDSGGLHGEYQFRDTGQVVLVAGDAGDGVVELDESDDGTRISGQWVGKLAADGTFKGVWSNVDESDTESIELHRVASGPSGK
ncbi:conserved protein of unknown function [Pararobbsia alpina]|uniref:hypothetical protein n=1 Tax=Pararobbsia alpina TaxID=621374 RepID=UPI0039A658F0